VLQVRDLIKLIRKFTDPILRTVQLTIGRAVLKAVTDSSGIQVVKLSLLQGEVKEMERFQNYGFTSVPILGSCEGVAVFVGGNREHGICIGLDDRLYRLKNLGEGQAAMYDSTGTNILMKNDGSMEIKNAAGTCKITINTNGQAVIESNNVEIGKTALEKALKGETFQAWFNAHTHTGNVGAPTSPPNQQSIATHLSSEVKLGGGIV